MLEQFLQIIVRNTGVDFYDYKPTTLQRRIVRRMHLLDIATEPEYLQYLLEHEQEQHLLYKEMLIHVTSFFRDEASFDYLCAEVIPAMLKSKGPDDMVRIWVCGCATGEEAYSIAICFHEHLQQVGDLTRIKIFASDLSETAIARARRGIYNPAAFAKGPEKRTAAYFNAVEGGYQIKPFIREMCTFAVHNVLQHPPFANIDLLSCRNVLIYMKPVLQKKILATFSYALREGGYLFLGKSETSVLAGKFEPVSKSANIYLSKERDAKLFSIHNANKTTTADMNHAERQNHPERKDFQRAADDMLLSKYIPAGVIVNEANEIVDFRGATGFYIEPSPGIASWNVLKMVRKGLYYDLQEALNKAKTERVAVRKPDIALEHDGALLRINLEVQPLSGTKEKYYLVLFQQVPQPPAGSLVSDDGINTARDLRILQLEQELMQSREQLRALSEEQEATSEEFQSANEELKTLNEELQTSQEELISINEEVSQRNKELNALNKELAAARNFSDSINDTVNDALLVLDKTFRVKGANRSYYTTFKVKPAEILDRPIYELGNKQWNIPELRRMLEENLPEQSEIAGYLVKNKFEHLGYRVMSLNARQLRTDGEPEPMILLAIRDITEAYEFEQKLKENNFKLQFAFDTARVGNWELSLPAREFQCSAQFKSNLGLPADAVLTYDDLLLMLVDGDGVTLQEAIALAADTEQEFTRELRFARADGAISWLTLSGMALYNGEGKATSILGIAADITFRKEAEQKLRQSEKHFRLLADSAPAMIAMSSGDGHFNFYNKSWLDYTNRSEGYSGTDWVQDIHPDDRSNYEGQFDAAVKKQARFHTEFRLRHKSRYRWVSCTAVPRFDHKDGFDGYTMACSDIHDQKLMSEALERKVEERTEALRDVADDLLDKNRELEQFAYVTSHDLQEPLRKILMFSSVLLRKSAAAKGEDKDYLVRIEQSATRMVHLIQDLLNYSGLKENARDFLPADLNKIVQHVLIDFDLLIQEKDALLTIGSLPTIDAVPLQISQLFYNLVSNALKFSRDGVRPEIRITAYEVSAKEMEQWGLDKSKTYCRIDVEDNGIGFSDDYRDRIFEIFQRLHSKDQYQGNGIGLALCRRIVRGHNGELIPVGREGEGATFQVLLPLKQ